MHNYGIKRLGSTSSMSLRRKLSAFHNRLDRVTVECLDWEKCVRLYDCVDSLHFIDPPYTTMDSIGTYRSWTSEDVNRLRSLLSELKGRWIVTLNDDPANRAAFSGCQFIPVSTHCSLRSKDKSGRRFSEIIITP